MRYPHQPAPQPTCPTWCCTDHQIDIDIEDGIRVHAQAVTRDVEVVATDDLELGTREPTEVIIRSTSCATPHEVRQLALALLAAGDLIEGGGR